MSDRPNSDYDDPKYKRYLEEKRDLEASRLQQQDSFDKAMLTVSTAGIGVSLVFLKVWPSTGFGHFSLAALVFSWILFIATILATIISFQLSQVAHEHQLKVLEEFYQDDDYEPEGNPVAKSLQAFSLIALISFVVAIILLLTFVLLTVSN